MWSHVQRGAFGMTEMSLSVQDICFPHTNTAIGHHVRTNKIQSSSNSEPLSSTLILLSLTQSCTVFSPITSKRSYCEYNVNFLTNCSVILSGMLLRAC